MQAVTGKDLKPVVATLTGYHRFKFKEKTYPGLIKNEASLITGMLYQGIDEETLNRLDQFEDVMYERYLFDVQVDNKTEQAFVYVTKDEYSDRLSNKEWSLEEFKSKYLNYYLRDISKL